MLIAIAIAEEIQGLQRIALVPEYGTRVWYHMVPIQFNAICYHMVPMQSIEYEDLLKLPPGLVVFSLRFRILLI